MKNLNLIKRLWTDSREKQSPQRFARYAAMLIMLLTLGVGQMWAGYGYNGETHVYLNVDGTTKYYKVSTESWSTGASLPGTWGGVLKDQTFSNIHTLEIKGGAVGGWTENGGNISGNLYYKVTNNTTTPSSGWTTVGGINANYTAKSGNNCFRYKNDYSVNVTPHTAGTYYLHIKITDGASNNRTSYVKFTIPSYTVAGSSTVLGTNWDQTDTDNDMTYSSGTTYTLTKSNVTLTKGNTYEYKVALNHAWGTSYPGSNASIDFGNTTGHYDVTFTFNASTKAVSATATRLYAVIYNDNGKTSGSVPATSYHANGATVTVASNSGSLAKTGYSFGGWNTNSSGTGTNYTAGSGTFTMGSSDKNLFAKWTENMSTVSFVASPTGKGTFQVNSSTVTSTTAGVTTTRSVTAVPISGYHFVSWSITGGASISSTTTNPTTVTGGGAGTAATLTATFAADDVYSLTVAAGTGISAVTGSTNDIKAAQNIAITATVATGYTWNTWTKTGAGSLSTFTAGTKNQTVTVGTAGDITLTASATENMSTLSTSNHYDAGDPSYSAPSKSVSSIGISTTADLTAAAPGTGYTFAGWTLSSNIVVTSGNAATDRSITIRTNGNGAAATAQANYTEDLSSPYTIKGGTNITGNNWSTAYNMTKKSGHSTESVVYYTFNISSTNSGVSGTAGDWSFKVIKDGSTGYGLYASGSYWWRRSTSANQSLKTGTQNIQICADVVGPYEIKVDYTTPASPKVTVTFPTKYTVTYSVAPSGAADAITTSPNVSSGGEVASGTSITFTHASANTGYTWYRWENGSGSSLGTGSTYNTSISANTTVVAKYTENNYNVTVTKNLSAGGSVTPTSVTAMGQVNGGDITATPNTGYNFTNWTITSGTGYFGSTGTSTTSTTKNTKFRPTAAATIRANFTAKQYTITLNNNGGEGGTSSVKATYKSSTLSTAITNPTRTGYTFNGWHKTNGTGQLIINTGGALQTGTDYTDAGGIWNNDGAVTLYAGWTPKTTTVSFSQSGTGYGSGGQSTTKTATYDAAMPTPITCPTAANGYAFMGYYDALEPLGTQYYDETGASAHLWDKEDATATLYAYFKKAEITALTLDAATVESNGTVYVKPTIDPTPTGTTKLSWYILYANGNKLTSQPTISGPTDGKYSFTAPEASGMYIIAASLRTGTGSHPYYGGTLLDSTTVNFQVAGTHTVTVRYKCGGEDIKAATALEGIRPLDWSDAITAPEIIGYSFTGWSAGDGVTLTDDDGSSTKTSTATASIKIKAIYDGYLTANYSKKRIIYFNNTLNWENVYVYFYKNGTYWDDTYGTGCNTGYQYTDYPFSESLYGQMQPVEEGSKIYYFDAEAAGVNASYQTVVFTELDQHTYDWFAKTGDVKNKVIKRDDYYSSKLPMYVPLAVQTPVSKNGNKADYYWQGYWMNYPENTGYTLKIYNKKTRSDAPDAGSKDPVELKSIPFEFTADKTMPMELNVDLEAGQTYGFKIWRNDGLNTGAGSYYGNTGTMTENAEGWSMTTGASSNAGLQTTAAGSYKFVLNFYEISSDYQYRVSVTYPVASGDYRLLYKDDVHTLWHPSAVIPKASAKDTVSFFVRKGQHAYLKLQKCTALGAGTVTWSDTIIWWNNGSSVHPAVTQDSVYNLCLMHNASTGKLEIENVEAYTGNYYIRTDAANSKWDNYRTDPDHLMTYSEYSITHGGYSHYYTHWVQTDDRKNIKFTIANDYSPCISDTLARETASGDWANITNYVESNGDLKRNANVRFMWNRHDNTIKRAYVDGAQDDGSEFLLMLNTDSQNRIRWADESALTSNKVTFSDNGNWIYEANIQAKPNAQIKLKSTWGTGGTAIVQYFKGSSSTSEDLVGGSGDTWYDIRVIYDFKTNRLVASYIPRGKIDNEIEINADVMFIREHQGDIAQLTFGENGAIKKIETAYGVLRFNKWTLNNKEKTGTHEPLASPKSRYERDLFYVSFPFRVSMEEVFGFGTYGTHWIIEYYDGAGRATNGYWLESGPNWKFIWDRKNQFFEPNQGYIIALELDELGESSSVWANTEQVELYFPSYGTMPDITNASVKCTIPEHTCTINRSGGALGPEYDRRVKDSHWNVISVPTYVNTNNPTFANTYWITTADETHVGPNFLYEWNPDDNSVTARSGIGYNYQAMHAYLVQYCGAITWTSSVSPAAAPRRNPAYRGEYEFRLEMVQNDQVVDQTYVKLSDDEHVTTGFEFNYDMSKEFNKSKANIYTLIGTEPVAGNVLPMTDQTTVVPVGVKIATIGDYTFSMPNGTYGVGVTLIDNETGIRTSLSALDYTINLSAGEYTNRFFLEISPIKPVATGVEQSQMTNHQSQIKKVLVDELLYIVKDGKVFDAHGNRVK